MRHSYVLPLGVLAVILAFCMWNARSMTGCTDRWSNQLNRVESLAMEERWQDAEKALAESYADWQRLQTYLHIVSRHEVADNAESMYRRAAVCTDERDLAQLQTELSDLRHQLGLLAEMEQCNLRNIL
ncbi:DUF4363 family protein [uncultured Oscillibacter sp.]|uniref:DUF4363 family protein n=1 Tax=uncultured Oscillibacter sp. TaxID=876091 RepID=UPI00280B8C09|nr:DUF4363 family protein [uncultured Oscillibacter sp.]